MNNPLRELKPGEEITSAFLNSIVRQLRAICPQPSNDVLVSTQPGGTTYSIRKRPPTAKPPAPAMFPFEIYQQAADPTTPAPEDWRTFRVHSGTCNSAHPANDDSFAPLDPTATDTTTNIIIPAGSDTWKIWLSAGVDTGIGVVDDTTWTIKNGATGWSTANGDASSYPLQPKPTGPGLAPSNVYILLGEVTTGSDTLGDSTYQQSEIFQNASTNFLVQRFIQAAAISAAQGGCYPDTQILWWAV